MQSLEEEVEEEKGEGVDTKDRHESWKPKMKIGTWRRNSFPTVVKKSSSSFR